MIIDLQRRLAEIGRIRIGQQVTSGGKSRPAKLETFRLTSSDRTRVELAARLYGGKPQQWDAPAGKQWEVITAADALNVIVPPSDMSFSQFYELWSAGGCQRRCDGGFESISDGPCKCDPENRQCDIHSRLSVMLADLPGLGVWRIDTSGYYAAVELQGAVDVIRLAAGRGQMLPARLRLDQRSVKRPGDDGKPVTRRFAVPVLDIEVSPGQLLGSAGGRLQIAGGGTVDTSTGEITGDVDGTAPLTPVPESVPARPVASIAEQARVVEQPAEKKPRKNAKQPVPSTGLAPRTAAEAKAQAAPKSFDGPSSSKGAADAPSGGGEASESEPVPPSGDDSDAAAPQRGASVTKPQLTRLHVVLGENDLAEREPGLRWLSEFVGRPLSSSKELTKDEAMRAMNELERRAAEKSKTPNAEPTFDDVPLPPEPPEEN